MLNTTMDGHKKYCKQRPHCGALHGRVMWFARFADPVQFLAHVMVFGGVEDLKALRGIVGENEYREVLQHAPPGIFDGRSWAYWNLVCDRQPTPPLPTRALPSARPMPR